MIQPAALVLCLVFAALAAPLAAEAEQPEKIPRIGILRPGSPPDPFLDAFKRGLVELGYVEGRNIEFEYRWAEGKEERLPMLAAELVSLKVDVILAGATAALAAQHATASIPIVMPVEADPVGMGLVASLARPGGNVTGLASQNDKLAGKWIELLKEALPELSRVVFLWDPASDPRQVKLAETSARSLGLELQVLKSSGLAGLDTAFAEAKRQRAGAMVVGASAALYAHRARIVELAARDRLPTIYHHKEFVVGAGGLMSYGADFHDLFRRAAGYVDRILRGAKPADLPVQQPTKFELMINLKTAKSLGLTIPESVLARADEVIQ